MSTEVKISTSAKNYANSLLQVGKDGVMSYDDILNDLNTVKEIVSSSTELTQVMENPAVSDNTKYEILDSVFSGQINDKLINFLKVLIDKNRFYELNQIIEAYSYEVDEIHNVKRVEVVSAVEISDDRKQRLVEKLQNKLQKTVIPNWNVDKDIIGGLIIRIGDDLVDNSLRNKLENLSKNII